MRALCLPERCSFRYAAAAPGSGCDARGRHRRIDAEDRDLTPLSTATLAVSLIGLFAALAAWVAGRGSAAPFAALFTFGVLHQGVRWLAGTTWPLPAEPVVLAEGALLAAGAAGLVALWTSWRTTRERDEAEDLHWDSMEMVRGLAETSARAGGSFDEKLARVLELGCARFALDHAVAVRLHGSSLELLASRAPEGVQGIALANALEPRLRLAADSPRALASRNDQAGATPPPAFLGAAARLIDGSPCVLAFAGEGLAAPVTATDKDLCLLLAQWLRGELELRSLAQAMAVATATAPQAAAPAPTRIERRPAHDLNEAVHRSEHRLRSLVAADATLELALADALPPLRAQRLGFEALVEALVVAAHGLAPSGALRIETSALAAGAPGEAESHATLSVRVRGSAIDAGALARAFADTAPHAEGIAPPLAQVEALLRRAGGDLSVHVEPGRGAVLTAFLPGRQTARVTRALVHPVEPAPL